MDSSLLRDPWLWLIAGGIPGGAGLGLLLRALACRIGGRRVESRKRSVVGLVFLAAFVLCAAGLLIFPDKAILADPSLLVYALVCGGMGLLAGLLPRAFGIPLVLVVLSAWIYLVLALDGWQRLDSPKGIVTVTAWTVDEKGMRGEVSYEGKDSIMTIKKIDLPSDSVSLYAERLELEGPLALFAGGSFYRVSGLGGGAGVVATPPIGTPLASPLLEYLLPLGEGPKVSASMPFVRRWKLESDPRRLAALEPLRFKLDPKPAPGSTGLEAE